MNSIFLAALLLQAGTGAIQGVLIDARNSMPMAGAQITLARLAVLDNAPDIPSPAAVPTSLKAASDAAGMFSFKNLPPGLYRVEPEVEGYFAESRTASLVSVTDGRTATLSLRLVQGSVIAGRVVDSNGEPMSSVNVQASTIFYQVGAPVLGGVASQTTDDRGEYRLFWVPPGEYYVAVTPKQPARNAKGMQSLKTFYPDAVAASSAMPVTVRGGEEMTGIDIHVRAGPLAKISGQVTSTVTPGPPPATEEGIFAIIARTQSRSISFLMLPRDDNILDRDRSELSRTIGLNGSSGTFEIPNVPVGTYDLYALTNDPNDSIAFGRTSIDVRGQDVNDVKIAIRPGVDVKGALTVDGRAPGQSNVRVLLQPDGPLLRLGFRPQPEQVAADGSFTLRRVPEGHYRLSVLAPASDTYVETVHSSDMNVYDSGVDIDSNPRPLQVTMRSGAGALDGNTAPGATVALIPMTRRENPVLYYQTIADPTGKFSMRNLTPGEYKLFAWHDVPPGAIYNPAFVMKYESQGKSVTVGPGASAAIQIDATQ
jgi:hypothetical protein